MHLQSRTRNLGNKSSPVVSISGNCTLFFYFFCQEYNDRHNINSHRQEECCLTLI